MYLKCTQAINLIAGIGRRASLVGFDLVEMVPSADVGGLSALTAAPAGGQRHRSGGAAGVGEGEGGVL